MLRQAKNKKTGTHSDYDKDWWRGGVIYQIYPRSYADSNGDGIGDLKGITSKLEYIASLGVDAIWISPFFKSPMKDFGYDVSDYLQVDPLFGTNEDFDDLVKKARSLGLHVMIDQVLSHTSDEHPWFVESRSSRNNPKADWFVWADPKPDGTPPNNWLSIFGGSAWEWDTRRCQYYLHNFLTSQPDLNFNNPVVRQELLKTCDFWLKKGVTGFRLDTVNFFTCDAQLRDNPANNDGPLDYVPATNPYGMQKHIYDKSRPENLIFIEELRALLDKYPNTAAVGEMGAQDSLTMIGEYTRDKNRLHMVYTFHFMNQAFSPQHIVNTLEYLRERIGNGWPCWSFSNHDVPRAVSRWNKHEDFNDHFAKLMIGLLTSMRGSVCMYQGEELGLPEADIPYELIQDPYGKRFWPEFKGRDGCRTPMPWQHDKKNGGFSDVTPWLPVPEEHQNMAVDLQDKQADSVLNFCRNFLKWRKDLTALKVGSIEFLDLKEPILGILREWKEDKILCVFNLSNERQQIDLSGFANIEALVGHGYESSFDGKNLQLSAFSAFYAKVK